MVRLVFRPYTKLRRSICTLEPLQSSTRVSSGFDLASHSSPSFGSQLVRSVCASTAEADKRRDDDAPPLFSTNKRQISPFSLSLRLWVSINIPMARAQVRLLGPCFKTGQVDISLSNAAKATFVPSLNQLPPPRYQQVNLFKISPPIRSERTTNWNA
jgi:hypothetical protein